MNPGRLIVFEGIDGAGTSTQAERLHRWLQATCGAAQLCREPSPGPLGALLRRALQGELTVSAKTLCLLFAADRLQQLETEILPRRARGTPVVSDRSIYSTLAYQGATLPLDWIAELNRWVPEPDLVIYLRVPAEVASRRREARGGQAELFDDLAMQTAVASVYDALLGAAAEDGRFLYDAARPGWRRISAEARRVLPAQAKIRRCPEVAIIDGTAAVDAIHSQLCELVSFLLSAEE